MILNSKFVFFGTPIFSAIILEKLIKAGFVPVTVVTNPDRPVGRKKILTASAVKNRIMNHQSEIREKIEILQPEKLDSSFVQRIKSFNLDFGILAAYGKIIPQEIINIFPKGIIVVHPSLLPKYRGATPIQSALLAGEIDTGTTLFLMDKKVDHGKIISDIRYRISNIDNYETLSKKLAGLSANLLIKTLPDFLAGKIKSQSQNHRQATYTKKFTSKDGQVDLKKDSPEMIWRKVRALTPEPGVWIIKNGRRMKLLAADLVDGKLILKKVQFEGRKPTLYIPHSHE